MWFYIAVLLYALGCIRIWAEESLYWDKVAFIEMILWPVWTAVALVMEVYYFFKGNNNY